MYPVINNSEQKLSPPEIIFKALEHLDLDGLSPQVAATSIVREFGMPRVDALQIGNTVFIGHRGEGKNKDMMWGRALTVDTAQNFISSGLQYFTHLQDIGIKRYVADYDGAIYDSAFKTWKRYTDKGDSEIAVGRKSDGGSRAYVTLGKMPLSEVV
tara:strand:- start:144 stop:611 length:468 start_codon:yes stop_codon:yes gene_type:complete